MFNIGMEGHGAVQGAALAARTRASPMTGQVGSKLRFCL